MKSFRKDGSDEPPPGAGRNAERDFRGEKRSNETHASTTGWRSAIDGRTTRHASYRISQRLRKRIEEPFGWIKSVAGLRKTGHRGLARVGWMFTLTAAASNLVRLPKLLASVT